MERRIKALFILFFISSGILFVKLLYLTTVKNEQYEKAVLSQQEGRLEAGNIRGGIFDRNLIELTERETSPWHITPKAEVAKGEGDASFELPERSNRNGFCAHLLGYTSHDGSGLCGVERKYDSILKTNSVYTVAYTKSASGAPIKNKEVKLLTEKNSNEKSIVLTIDYHIQKITEEVMEKHIQKGAVVVIDTESFEILAMASRPTYNAEKIESYLSSDKGELMNRALCAYNAGSVFKIITASAAIEKNPGYKSKEFFCNGSFEYDGKSFLCHKNDGHGTETFHSSFANSCNCAFYETALDFGGKSITDTAKKFGLGQKALHIGNEEANGFIPSKRKFEALEAINLGIGQGDILITPLQAAVVTATIANDGVRKEVKCVKGIADENGKIISDDKTYQSLRVIKESTAKTIGEMMRECVLTGTAKSIGSSPIETAGKTGSAETGWLRNDGTPMVHGWFCGFFPYSSPKYAIAVFCEDGKSGAESCVKPFLEICEKTEEIYPSK